MTQGHLTHLQIPGKWQRRQITDPVHKHLWEAVRSGVGGWLLNPATSPPHTHTPSRTEGGVGICERSLDVKLRAACLSSCAWPQLWAILQSGHIPAALSRLGRSMGVTLPHGEASLYWLDRQAQPRASEPFGTWEGCAFDRSLLWSEAMVPLLYIVLPTLGSYVMLSIFFLRRPHLLHTPRTPVFPIRLAAHRGGELSQGGGRAEIYVGWSEPNKTGAMVGSPTQGAGHE